MQEITTEERHGGILTAVAIALFPLGLYLIWVAIRELIYPRSASIGDVLLLILGVSLIAPLLAKADN